MPKLRTNNADIHYELDGDHEETLVLLNGIMMSTISWAAHVPYLNAGGVSVLRVDFRDQGQSGRAGEPYSLQQHVDDLAELFGALDIGPVHLHGISYGGQVALLRA